MAGLSKNVRSVDLASAKVYSLGPVSLRACWFSVQFLELSLSGVASETVSIR